MLDQNWDRSGEHRGPALNGVASASERIIKFGDIRGFSHHSEMLPHYWSSGFSRVFIGSSLLIAGASPVAIADLGHNGSTGPLAECVALGLSTCPRPFDAVLPAPADMLSWDQNTRVVGFRNTYRQYPGDVFHAQRGNPYPLPQANKKMPPLQYRMDGNTFRLKDYLHRQSVTGLLILKGGQRVFEYYGRGNTDRTLWTSRSVAKSVVSVLRYGNQGRADRRGRRPDHALLAGTQRQRLGGRDLARYSTAYLGRDLERELRGSDLGIRAPYAL